MKVRRLILSLIIVGATVVVLGRPTFASMSNWFLSKTETWEFMQSVGGIEVGQPTRSNDGKVSLPVRCDVSGLTVITHKPEGMNSALVVLKVSKRIKKKEVLIAVKTGLHDKKSSPICGSVNLGKIAPGPYQIYYYGPEKKRHLLAEVSVP